MRRLGLLLLTPFLLSACGGGGDDAAICSQVYWDGEIGTCLPDAWEVADGEVLDARGVPPETVVVFQKEERVSGQFPTVVVTHERLPDGVTGEEYSEASIRSVTLLPGYEEIDLRTIQREEGDLRLHVFTAQPISGEPARRFYQVSVVSPEGEGYTFTALTPLAINRDIESEVLAIVGNVSFTDPEAAAGE